METQVKKTKRGRKPMPEDQKKKTVWSVLEPNIYARLCSEIENGKAETHGQRVAQIVEMYYRNQDKKAKAS